MQEFQIIDMLCDVLWCGVDMVGGCFYVDLDFVCYIVIIFDIVGEFDVDVDFYLDFDLDFGYINLFVVIVQMVVWGWQGCVSIGYVINLLVMLFVQVVWIGCDLVQVGIVLIVLFVMDLFLIGCDRDRLVLCGIVFVYLMWG